jgi:Na+-transporting NADH:ubiquinone oxidoreductase subunit C|tara:strand:- start:16621 stop:17355 length:735 start_codon:yes stop_codon:yes gene_type:complete
MALNKESNGYTFGFAIVLVVVVGTVLALLSMGLKDKQDENQEVKKKMDILKAMLPVDEGDKITRKNANETFKKYINEADALILSAEGEVIGEGSEAFKIDIQKDFKDKTLDKKDRKYPLYIGKRDGKTIYILPVVGKGLWGPIWGNISLGDDMSTIIGVSFGHKGETPGLGAEITQQFFKDRWIDETISDDNGDFTKFEIVKDGSGVNPKKVDGITGGTITSKGVEEMVNRSLGVYSDYFKSLK